MTGSTAPRRRPADPRRWTLRALAGVAVSALLIMGTPGVSHATVSVSRAEISGTSLRIEGTAAASQTITVDGAPFGTSDSSGRFRIERSGYTPPADCTVDVNDGSPTPTTARLAGCTVAETAALNSLSVSPTTVVGGTPATGTVTLTAAAPAGGFSVALSSNNTAAATVPASVTVAAGATSASFTVTTNAVTNSQSSTIIATAGGVSRSATITVTTSFQAQNGSISLARGGVGHGTVTSQPAGVNCTFTSDSTSGTCNNVFFPAGTQVKLDARPASNSKFLGWEFETTCRDAPNVSIQAGVAHICRPGFALR